MNVQKSNEITRIWLGISKVPCFTEVGVDFAYTFLFSLKTSIGKIKVRKEIILSKVFPVLTQCSLLIHRQARYLRHSEHFICQNTV